MRINSISQAFYKPLSFGEKKHFQRQEEKILVPNAQQHNDLRVFYHHIYEYKKGLRNLVLTTEKEQNRPFIESRLKHAKIPYEIKEVNGKNINVFFGDPNCIKIVKTFDKPLNELSPEQDFMLGIMLGYDKILQCKRYFVMRDKAQKRNKNNGQ